MHELLAVYAYAPADSTSLIICAGTGCVGAKDCGVLMSVRLSKVMKEATFSYKVKFESGYDWTKGGKLPGLCAEGVSSNYLVFPLSLHWMLPTCMPNMLGSESQEVAAPLRQASSHSLVRMVCPSLLGFHACEVWLTLVQKD